MQIPIWQQQQLSKVSSKKQKDLPNRYSRIEKNKQEILDIINNANRESIIDKVIEIESKLIEGKDLLKSLFCEERKPRDSFDLAMRFVFLKSVQYINDNPEKDTEETRKYISDFNSKTLAGGLVLRYYKSKTPHEFLARISLLVPTCIMIQLYLLFYRSRDTNSVNLSSIIKKFVNEHHGQKNSYDILDNLVSELNFLGVQYDEVLEYKVSIESIFCPKSRPTKITPEQFIKWKEDTSIQVDKRISVLIEDNETEELAKAILYIQKNDIPDGVNESDYAKSLAKQYLRN